MAGMDVGVGASLHSVPNRSPWKRRLGLAAGGLAVLGVCLVVRSQWGTEEADARDPAAAPATPAAATEAVLKIVANVNGVEVSRSELAKECLRVYGNEVLESVINKNLIALECKRQGIEVTKQEVKAEIERLAAQFRLPADQWLKMLQSERNITPAQYAKDIIWPTLALRKLAAPRLVPTPQELQQAYETQFGPAVKARLIACKDRKLAEDVRAQAASNPQEFGNLAMKHSVDAPSASAKGLIQPIRKHVGDPMIERVAFQMKKGDVSPVIPVADQFIILLCEERLEGQKVARENVDGLLTDAIRDKKLRGVSQEVFEKLQKDAQVVSVFNDAAKRREMPGVAAIVNGQSIPLRDLAEECIERHGGDVLEAIISRKLLEQALQKKNLQITEQDIYDEVFATAKAMGAVDPKTKKVDVEGWLKTVLKEPGMTREAYERDLVWPSAALKKLVGDSVEVTDDDLRKGYESNYGPRVRARAIVLDNMRRAQEVWQMARQNLSVEHFGKLAEQYSIEGPTRALQGEVPPIQRHGGREVLEREAFALKPGEISGVIQVGQQFVILFCEGYTEPKDIPFAAVRDELFDEIHEKKLRLAMSRRFTELQDGATIDNFLKGTSHSPGQPAAKQQAARQPAARPQPSAPAGG